MNPHTTAKLDLAQIRSLVDDLLTAYTLWLPDWIKTARGT
jgi:alpha-galactosidase